MNFERQKYISNLQKKTNKLFWKEIQDLDYHGMHCYPKQIILRFWYAISLPPLEFEPMENSHKEPNGCQIGVKKSAFIPSKFGKENCAGLYLTC